MKGGVAVISEWSTKEVDGGRKKGGTHDTGAKTFREMFQCRWGENCEDPTLPIGGPPEDGTSLPQHGQKKS